MLSARLQSLDRRIVSDYLRPELQSQFLLEIDDHLSRRMSNLQVRERRIVVEGVAVAADIFPSKVAKDLQERINMRISRARRSIVKSTAKWDLD